MKQLQEKGSKKYIPLPDDYKEYLAIHDVDPVFDRGRLLYIYSNGFEEKLVLNQYL